MNSPLVISQSEFQQCEVQFITLKPVDGFLNGDQARSFFLQSGLPPPVLGQVSCLIRVWCYSFSLDLAVGRPHTGRQTGCIRI